MNKDSNIDFINEKFVKTFKFHIDQVNSNQKNVGTTEIQEINTKITISGKIIAFFKKFFRILRIFLYFENEEINDNLKESEKIIKSSKIFIQAKIFQEIDKNFNK